RQSGKNEAVAHLLVYLLNLYRRRSANIVFAAIGDGLGRGQKRLQQRLDNPWNSGEWRAASQPSRTMLGQAAVVFLSSHPQAAARGETAGLLLVVDELQDQDPLHLEAVFTPMRAARNATAVYLGTVRTRHDALWLKKIELEQQQEKDGRQRVFTAGPSAVCSANPAYGRFLQKRVARHGRYHPVIASEYFLEPLEGAGLLFPPRRLALMRGSHARQRLPSGDAPVVALLDIGGQDEAATESMPELENPARDYTVCTIVRLFYPTTADLPSYAALDCFAAQGMRFFAAPPGEEPLAERLLAYLRAWSVAHLVADATGVGEGLVDWLAARLGRSLVTPFKFNRRSKAGLGTAFLSLVESGRFSYWSDDAEEIGSDGWWFWQQAAHCVYDLASGGVLQSDMRWQVPAAARVSTPRGRRPVHDDRLLSAALIAEIDRLLRDGKLSLGSAHSAVIPPIDPLAGLAF
ncbi:MAG: hypothetical protein ACK2UK_19725, partial [Candidatus Promineifilaceae bacterium]